MMSYQNTTDGVHKHWMNKTTCGNRSVYTVHASNRLESSGGVSKLDSECVKACFYLSVVAQVGLLFLKPVHGRFLWL